MMVIVVHIKWRHKVNKMIRHFLNVAAWDLYLWYRNDCIVVLEDVVILNKVTDVEYNYPFRRYVISSQLEELIIPFEECPLIQNFCGSYTSTEKLIKLTNISKLFYFEVYENSIAVHFYN